MHRIRLRGPWTKTGHDGIAVPTSIPEPQRVTKEEQVPSIDVQTAEDAQHVCFARRFNRPTGLGPNTQVWLRFEGWIGDLVDLRLNDQVCELHPMPPAEVEITRFLLPHNCVELRLRRSQAGEPCLNGEVSLHITEAE